MRIIKVFKETERSERNYFWEVGSHKLLTKVSVSDNGCRYLMMSWEGFTGDKTCEEQVQIRS